MAKLKKKKYRYLPQVVSTSDLQRRSGRVIDRVKESTQPYFVVRNNKPQAVILSVDQYEELKRKQREWELMDAKEAIRAAEKAQKEGKLIELTDKLLAQWIKESREEEK